MAIINHLATKFILDTPISTQQFQRACRLQYFFYLHSLNRSLQNLSHKIFSIQEVMLVIRSILVHWKRSLFIVTLGDFIHIPFLVSPSNCPSHQNYKIRNYLQHQALQSIMGSDMRCYSCYYALFRKSEQQFQFLLLER